MTWFERLLLGSALVAVVAMLPRGPLRSSRELADAERERDGLAEANEQLRAENERLRAEVAALRPKPHDPAWNRQVDIELARVAREDLNLIRRGEVVVELPMDRGTAP